jgi:AmpD protein
MAPIDPALPAQAGWQQGWWQGASRVDSPNFGPRPADARVELVVLHSISLPPGQYGGDAIERLFTNQLDWSAHPYFEQIRGLEVSAHFVIDRQGRCTQFVSCDDRAWHAGISSWRGRPGCNDWSIGIELEGLEGQTFEPAQYQGAVLLLKAIATRYPVTEIVGHEHIAPGRKQDPGPGFDWVALSQDVGKPYTIDLPAFRALDAGV